MVLARTCGSQGDIDVAYIDVGYEEIQMLCVTVPPLIQPQTCCAEYVRCMPVFLAVSKFLKAAPMH